MPPKKKASAPPARATRSSVRAGTAALEDIPPPSPAPRTRKRSSSKASTSSTVESDCKIIVDDLKRGRTTVRKLTRPQLEAVVSTLLVQDEQHITHITELEDQSLEATHSITELRGEVSDLRNRLMERPKVRDIRRHYAIEVPTQQLLKEEAAKASAAARSAQASEAKAREEYSAKKAARKAKAERDRQADIAEEAGQQAQSPREQSNGVAKSPENNHGRPEGTPTNSTFSPSAWGLTSFFSSAVKRVFSPSPASRKSHQVRTNRVLSRAPSPIQEESSSSQRTPEDKTAQSHENSDLSTIVRKRKTTESDEQTPKRARVNETPSISTFNVPDNSDEENDEEMSGRVDPREAQDSVSPTPSTSAYKDSDRNNSELHPSLDQEHQSRSQSLSSAKGSSRRTKTPSRLSARTARTPLAQVSPSMNHNVTEQTTQMTTPTAATVDPATVHRRSAKQVREKREANAAARRHSEHAPMRHNLTSLATERIRPHFFEIQNVDSYATPEALDAAVDAMLDIEEAEEKGLPPPKTSVSPAVRVYPRIRMDHFAPTSASASAQKTSSNKPKEANADKREAQIQKAREDKEAERKRLLEKSKELREQQQKAEDELRKLEMEDEANQEIGKKRKRVRVDDLAEIPCRRPGQSTGTFALLDEFFDQDDEDDYVEMDEDEIHLISSRPNKIARTEANIFNTPSGLQGIAEFEPEALDSPTPAPAVQTEALQRKRSEAEKYKPTKSSRLREVQRVSTGSSAAGSPQAKLAFSSGINCSESEGTGQAVSAFPHSTSDYTTDLQTIRESSPTTPTELIQVYSFPSAEKLFSDEVLASIPPLTEEQRRQGLIDFRKGLAEFVARGDAEAAALSAL